MRQNISKNYIYFILCVHLLVGMGMALKYGLYTQGDSIRENCFGFYLFVLSVNSCQTADSSG